MGERLCLGQYPFPVGQVALALAVALPLLRRPADRLPPHECCPILLQPGKESGATADQCLMRDFDLVPAVG